ncbi:MAG: hypothetical protein KA715_11810 [Xanthomonadaceae bacterium]|nr:hypothetical protein [Xanthomonadaceae bacterium]
MENTEKATPAKTDVKTPAYSRKTLKKMGRDKRKAKLKTNPEFKAAYFGAKSTRSTAKKAAFRKSKTKKK